MTTLHSRIKKRRAEKSLSQAALAELIGVTQPTVANWERGGHIPRQGALDKIADVLDVDPVWLLSGQTVGTPNPLQNYLTIPIRHVPIFNWTDSMDVFDVSRPVSYMSMPVRQTEVFGMSVGAERLGQFQPNTMLVFGREDLFTESGLFLISDGHTLSLKPYDRTDETVTDTIRIARLIYAVQSF